jgi:hypothetical protein
LVSGNDAGVPNFFATYTNSAIDINGGLFKNNPYQKPHTH